MADNSSCITSFVIQSVVLVLLGYKLHQDYQKNGQKSQLIKDIAINHGLLISVIIFVSINLIQQIIVYQDIQEGETFNVQNFTPQVFLQKKEFMNGGDDYAALDMDDVNLPQVIQDSRDPVWENSQSVMEETEVMKWDWDRKQQEIKDELKKRVDIAEKEIKNTEVKIKKLNSEILPGLKRELTQQLTQQIQQSMQQSIQQSKKDLEQYGQQVQKELQKIQMSINNKQEVDEGKIQELRNQHMKIMKDLQQMNDKMAKLEKDSSMQKMRDITALEKDNLLLKPKEMFISNRGKLF